MAALAGLYGGGYGQSQEDGSGGRSGFFGRGQKSKFGGVPQTGGGAGGRKDLTPAELQELGQTGYLQQTGTAAELALLKE
jgi:hypothetical protein